MLKPRPFSPKLALLLKVLLLAPILGLFVVKLTADRASAARAVGMTVGAVANGLELTSLSPDRPAARAGLRPGDVLVAIAVPGQPERPVGDELDYDLIARGFTPGGSVDYVVERDGRRLPLAVTPGVPIDGFAEASSLLLILCFLGLAWLSIDHRQDDLRARLLATFCYLLAFEFALPSNPVGAPLLDALTSAAFLLVTGAQLAVELHLVSVIPDSQGWAKRRPWIVAAFYAVGLGLGIAGAWAELAERLGWPLLLPVDAATIGQILLAWVFPVWAAAVLAILAIPTFRHPNPEARNQAGLIFLGVLPWSSYALGLTLLPFFGLEMPAVVDRYFPLIMLCFAAAVFVSIFRYHLFDIEFVVKRSFLYGALSTTLVLVYCAAIGIGSLLFSQWLRDSLYSVLFSSAVMFVVGLTFSSLRRRLQGLIDRRLFPERQALRRRLVEVAAELPAQGTIAGMGSHLVERLGEILGVRQATLLLADPKSGLLFTIAAAPRRTSEDSSISFLIPPTDPALDRIREHGRPLPAAEAIEVSPLLARRFRSLEPELIVPLLSHDKLVGLLVLGLRAHHGAFRSEEIELLSLLAHQIASSFENIRLFESATYESLTGLLRREAVLDLLDREIDRAQRHGRPLVVGMADLDFFKSINDRYGHLTGDAVLKRVADELAASLRSSDTLGRYGGEEFLLVLPETDLEGGIAVAEKLRRRIEKLVLPLPDGGTVKLSISIGLAGGGRLASQDARTRTRLIEEADRALYQAKGLGRNRVEAAGRSEVASPPDPAANAG